VYGLARFAVREDDNDKKLEFLFKIYDLDRDGYISNGELFKVSFYSNCNFLKHNMCMVKSVLVVHI